MFQPDIRKAIEHMFQWRFHGCGVAIRDEYSVKLSRYGWPRTGVLRTFPIEL